MKKPELRDMLESLHDQLTRVETVKDSDREILESLQGDIQHLLSHPQSSAPHIREGLIESLREAIQRFEDSHPVLTQTIGRVVETLSEMGI